MYKIRDNDQNEFGPCTGDVIRQWIQAGRANAQTPAMRVGGDGWKALGEFAEFGQALGISLPASAADWPGARVEPARPVYAETSRLAVASAVLGALGFLGVTALAGLVAGVWALKAIGQSGGRLKGTFWAVAGSVVSGAMLLVWLPVSAGLYWVPMMKKHQQEIELKCYEHIRSLNTAFRHYAEKHEGRFPNAESWCDDLVQSGALAPTDSLWQCPSRPGARCGYAMNELLSGLVATNVPGDTVLLFESNSGWNGHGTTSIMASSRHGMFLMFVFADGSAERIPAWRFPQMRWIPKPTTPE